MHNYSRYKKINFLYLILLKKAKPNFPLVFRHLDPSVHQHFLLKGSPKSCETLLLDALFVKLLLNQLSATPAEWHQTT